jgi:uncharacterized protein YwgA
MGYVLRNIPEALKILYVIRYLGGSVGVRDLHKLVDRLAKMGICCKEYSFVNYPWGPYSRDLEVDLDILRLSGLVSIINGGDMRRIVLSNRGSEVAGRLEGLLDPEFKSKIGSIAENIWTRS